MEHITFRLAVDEILHRLVKFLCLIITDDNLADCVAQKLFCRHLPSKAALVVVDFHATVRQSLIECFTRRIISVCIVLHRTVSISVGDTYTLFFDFFR